jgi:hypothetical protein
MTHGPNSCPTCGHPIPFDQVSASLVGKRRKLYEIVAAAGINGISSMQIMTQLYADDPTGGPESQNIVCVMVGHVNRRLERHGVAIKGRSGHGDLYRLVALAKDRGTPELQRDQEIQARRPYHYGYDD